MFRSAASLLVLGLAAMALQAQDFSDLQVHGFANQGFVYSSNNNFLTMRSSKGSFQWTEGAVSVSDPINDRLRIGIQLHMYQIGQLGGPNLAVDWAQGDYKINDYLGFRAGKIKIPMGLFNVSQDVDSLFLWVLLPQSVYPIENREMDLSLLGGQGYGGWRLGERAGTVQYAGYFGDSIMPMNGGYGRQLAAYGLTFPNGSPSGRNFGGDLRWLSSKGGFMIGASAQSQAIDGQDPLGTLHMPPAMMVAYYGQWTHGKFTVEGEYWRTPLYPVLNLGEVTVPAPMDGRAWYPMLSYRVTKKLQVGTYYSHFVNKSADTSQPANYSKDWAISGRYNFNEYFYGKIETHFLDGTAVGYDATSNPNGLKDNSTILAARVGFAF